MKKGYKVKSEKPLYRIYTSRLLLVFLLSSSITAEEYNIDPLLALSESDYPPIFDVKFRNYLQENYKNQNFNHKNIATTEYIKDVDFYSTYGNGISLTRITFDEQFLLTEAYLDYAVLRDNTNLSLPVLSKLVDIDFSSRVDYSDPYFIDFLVRHLGKETLSLENLFKASGKGESVSRLVAQVEKYRPAAFDKGGEYGYVELEFDDVDMLFLILYIEYNLELSDGIAEKILHKIRYTKLPRFYWDQYEFAPQLVEYIRTEYSDLETIPDIKDYHAASGSDSYEYFYEDPAYSDPIIEKLGNQIEQYNMDLEMENKELLLGMGDRIETLNWDGITSLLRVISNDIALNEEIDYDDDLYYEEKSIVEIKNNKRFKKWLKNNIGEREPLYSDLENFGSPFAKREWQQAKQDKIARSIFMGSWDKEKLLRELYESYEQDFVDKKANTYIALIKSDEYFITWLKRKLRGKALTTKTIELLGYTFFAQPYESADPELAVVTESKQEIEKRLYDAAYFKYKQEGYAPLYRTELDPMEASIRLRQDVEGLNEWPDFVGICKDRLGRFPRINVGIDNHVTGQATMLNKYPIIRLNAPELTRMDDLTIFWQILHECGHHALGHTKPNNAQKELSLSEHIEIELKADCWASKSLMKLKFAVPDRKTRKIEFRKVVPSDMKSITDSIKLHAHSLRGYPPAADRINEIEACLNQS